MLLKREAKKAPNSLKKISTLSKSLTIERDLVLNEKVQNP